MSGKEKRQQAAEKSSQKTWKYAPGVGSEFGAADVNKLSELGKSIVTNFIEDNLKREEYRRYQEEAYERWRRSKPQPSLNTWKFSHGGIGYFSMPELDKINSYRIANKEKTPVIKKPFLVTKSVGDYFDKDIKPLLPY